MSVLSSVELITRRHGFGDGDRAIRAWKRADQRQDELYPAGKPLLLTAALAESGNQSAINPGMSVSEQRHGRRTKQNDSGMIVYPQALLAVEQAFADREPEYKYGGTF